MTRTVTLAAIKAGITRLRIKGGASPDSLYDLKDGYVTAARTIKPRPGSSADAALPAGKTIGLTLLDGVFQVFTSDASVDPDLLPEGYALNILIHPVDAALTLKRIWKAARYMGVLYVVAEWSDGSVWHFYLESGDVWQANTFYSLNQIAYPTAPNGFRYRATRLNPPGTIWAPNAARTIGDVIEPTVSNGYEYEVIDTIGASPRSGAVEPKWPASDGAIVYEDADAPSTPGTGGGSDDNGTDSNGGTRYNNPGGSLPSRRRAAEDER